MKIDFVAGRQQEKKRKCCCRYCCLEHDTMLLTLAEASLALARKAKETPHEKSSLKCDRRKKQVKQEHFCHVLRVCVYGCYVGPPR